MNMANSPWSSDRLPSTMDPMRDLDIDVRTLPEQVSPPDHWQELSACYGLDPEVFFPTTEEEAGLALSYCGVPPGSAPRRAAISPIAASTRRRSSNFGLATRRPSALHSRSISARTASRPDSAVR